MVDECWRTVQTHEATLVNDAHAVVRADKSRLQQLLENLIRNAIDHGGKDVSLTIGILNDGIGFYVADDGPGIPIDHREQVFDSGFSTSASGTGIGLAIVDQIVEDHDWIVTITEGETGGTRFEITAVDIEL